MTGDDDTSEVSRGFGHGDQEANDQIGFACVEVGACSHLRDVSWPLEARELARQHGLVAASAARNVELAAVMQLREGGAWP